jgi:hypothetical protein
MTSGCEQACIDAESAFSGHEWEWMDDHGVYKYILLPSSKEGHDMGIYTALS